MGHDGAQGVEASAVTLKPTSSTYSFAAGEFTNIDASEIVCHGDTPSGAHSDIFHSELAWAMLSAADLVLNFGFERVAALTRMSRCPSGARGR